ncbi:hypothetical protein [uncultured Lactobacillus sp.]|uniref:hypothetical protein n=1 Tax=uncultured Lactobacillus sp. TaxID=153152 RepID=UPI0025F2910D|nr:hypothetical protein [uncultured Lactobacillus sp.]
MEEKTGRERNEAIKQINDDEELSEIAREDPDAILLHDPEGSVITTAGGYGCYKNSEDFLKHRLKVNHESLDRLCKELDYDPYELLEAWMYDEYKPDIDELVNEAYDSERLGDIYAR